MRDLIKSARMKIAGFFGSIPARINKYADKLSEAADKEKRAYAIGFEDGKNVAFYAAVTRCRECIHRGGEDGQCPTRSTGDPHLDFDLPDDGFCSEGERRINDDL